jgi:hypothetical protein
VLEFAIDLFFGVGFLILGAGLLVVGALVFFDYRHWGSRWDRSVNEWRQAARDALPAVIHPQLWFPDVGPIEGTLLGLMLLLAGGGAVAFGVMTIGYGLRALR